MEGVGDEVTGSGVGGPVSGVADPAGGPPRVEVAKSSSDGRHHFRAGRTATLATLAAFAHVASRRRPVVSALGAMGGR
jgi:hypothetical protein